MTEQGRKSLRVGCGNREGQKAELMDWAGAGLLTAPRAQTSLSKAGPSPDSSVSGRPSKLGGDGVDGGKIGRGPCSEQGKESELASAPCKEKKEHC